MAYVALYRAYRPQKFSEVVGQEHIIKTLQNAIKMNKVAHAYLFCGPRGTGKTTLAKIMAKAMNCEHGPAQEPCCECEICKGITKGMISDVIEIDAASNNGADDIRDLRDTVKYLPSVGKYKVYIIDEVHMLSNAAFNALLKTLEEPPHHVIFILATTEPYKLPATILSRCQRFDFQSISIDDILKRLRIVASDENIKISEEALHQIAVSAEGGMRDALSLFDQCISYSQNPEITLDDVLSVSGNISYLKIIELLNACISKDETSAVLLLDKIIKEGKEVPRIINDIILFLRDLLLFKNNAVLEDKLMFKNEEFIKLSKIVGKGVIYQWLDILNDASNQMRYSTQKRAFLELAVLKMNDNEQNDNAALKDRIDSLERTVDMLSRGGFVKPTEYQAPKPVSKPEPDANMPHIPTKEEILAMRSAEPEPMDILPPASVPEDIAPVIPEPAVKPVSAAVPSEVSPEIRVADVVEILNHSSKPTKAALMEVWNKIREKYANLIAVQILVKGTIVAASEDAFVVELQDASFCNRVMQYENYVKIIEIFSEFSLNIKDYICIPSISWKRILNAWMNSYKAGNKTPVLEEFPLNIRRRIVPQSKPAESDETTLNQVLELFDDNELKITEE